MSTNEERFVQQDFDLRKDSVTIYLNSRFSFDDDKKKKV